MTTRRLVDEAQAIKALERRVRDIEARFGRVGALKADVAAIVSASESEVVTNEGTSSTSYTDLATSGPSVTLATGTAALVIWGAQMQNDTAGEACKMSFAVSGASSSPGASDNRMVGHQGAANNLLSGSNFHIVTGLTAGSNTFTAKYSVTGGTGSFRRRRLAVIPLGA